MSRRRARAIVDEFLDTAREVASANDTQLFEVRTTRIERVTAAS
jgi:hypothetical protein